MTDDPHPSDPSRGAAAPDEPDARHDEPKTRRGRVTRTRLLDAAAIEFGQCGFRDASINAITSRAGVAMGTFYVHFPSKEAVFRAVVEHMGRVTRAYIAERVDDAPDRLTAEEQGIQAYLDFVRAHPGIYRIVMEAQFIAEDAYRDYYMRFAAAYVEKLDGAAVRGEIRSGDAEVRAWALIGASVFLGLRFGLWDGERVSGEVAREAGRLIGAGLAPDKAGTRQKTIKSKKEPTP
ncbi:MAG: TetR/AcrR family transcriptional regulator [Alphaproteobacteria bacterium]